MSDTTPWLKPTQLLIVEDEQGLAKALQRRLSAPRRVIDVVGSMEAAREAVEFADYDLALIDMELPDGFGLDFVPELRQACPSAEAIIMTAHESVDAAVRSVHHGVFDFLRKPFGDMAVVDRAVERALEKVVVDREERAAIEELAGTAERYSLAARATSDGLWDWDLRADCLYVSGRWLEMLGMTDRDMGNEPKDWLDLVHREDADKLRHALAGLCAEVESIELEYRIRHRDGNYRWVCVRGIAERDERGETYRMAGSQSDVHERKQAEERLRHAALHDALTGLPNRALFLDRLQHALLQCKRDQTRAFTVLFVDLDRFKHVNDSLGHEAGDALLVTVAERMHSALRETDTLARLGGDEFTVLLPDVRHPDDAREVVQRLVDTVCAPIALCGQQVFIGASIGAAVGDAHSHSGEELLRQADTAMYSAKAQGGGDAVFYDAATHGDTGTRLAMESDLRRALEQDEIQVHYQPIVSLRGDEVVGFEALVRWEHPTRGTVMPGDFIPLAEQIGLVGRIGERVLMRACGQLASWRATLDAELFVSVNLSAVQVRQGRLVHQVKEALKHAGLPADALKLEITEGVLIEHLETAAVVLEELRSLGVTLSLDDFGTGYSSLSYLHQLPIDAIKVDRTFVSRMGEQSRGGAMVHAIVQMANTLGIEVVAEGVENGEHAQMLRGLGCDYGQGHFYGTPATAALAERLLDDDWSRRVSRTFSLPPNPMDSVIDGLN